MRITILLLLSFLPLFIMAQRKKEKEKDHRKENFEQTGRPGENYRYTSGKSVYNPETGKYELVEGEWKKQAEEYSYDPKQFKKAKYKSRVYGNPFRRLFKIKPKSAKPATTPGDKKGEEKKEKPFTTGEEKK